MQQLIDDESVKHEVLMWHMNRKEHSADEGPNMEEWTLKALH